MLHPEMMEQYNKPANLPEPSKADPDLHRIGLMDIVSAKMLKNDQSGMGHLV